MKKRPVKLSELSKTMQKALKDLQEVNDIIATLGIKKPYLTCMFEDIEKNKRKDK
jgi:hypothetical protein